MSQGNRVFVIGVGMTKFERCDKDARQLGQEAATAALQDANMDYDKIEQGFCGYINGMSTLGQQTLYGVGMTGIPVYNVNNNCSTGSTALFLARQTIESMFGIDTKSAPPCRIMRCTAASERRGNGTCSRTSAMLTTLKRSTAPTFSISSA